MKDWNEEYWTEGLDRIYTIQGMVELLLVESEDDLSGLVWHPAIAKADMGDMTNELRVLLAKMYQTMGEAIPDSKA